MKIYVLIGLCFLTLGCEDSNDSRGYVISQSAELDTADFEENKNLSE
jgi:hypothetical protein